MKTKTIIVFVLLACSCERGSDYQSIYKSEQGYREAPVYYCLGIKKNAALKGYVPNPYGFRIPRIEFPVLIDGQVEEIGLRIQRRIEVESAIISYDRALVAHERCVRTEDKFELQVFRDPSERGSGCQVAPNGAAYFPVARTEELARISCVSDDNYGCGLKVYQGNWQFDLTLPQKKLVHWKSVVVAFVSFAELTFDDLGECE